MSNRLFQSIIHKMKDAVGRTMGVLDTAYTVVSCSDLDRIGENLEFEFMYNNRMNRVGDEAFVNGAFTYMPMKNDGRTDYFVFAEGTDTEAADLCAMMIVALSGIKFYYDRTYDRDSFVKNMLFENVLPGDVFIKARELGIDINSPRTVYVIRNLSKTKIPLYDSVCKAFKKSNEDFVIAVNETDVALIKQQNTADFPTVEAYAERISETLTYEGNIGVCVGVGSTAEVLKDVSRSFKEACLALEVGRIFKEDISVFSYENLGLSRLIYQLPIPLCESYLKEVFKCGSFKSLDNDLLSTALAFFENNLNASETSRKMFIHRNTLIFRLEKIKKLTGFDLCVFEDAVTFKIAVMVNKYLKNEKSDNN